MTAPRYRPVDARVSPRFAGLRTFMRLPHTTELEGVNLAIVGIPFDTATSFRSGARFGPAAIRNVSSILRPYHPLHEVDIFDHLSAIDYGDLGVVPGNTVRTLELAAEALEPLLEADVFPLVLGGDHTVTLAELRALAKRYGPLAVVHFDAHGDAWEAYFGERYFHGTILRRAAEEGLLLPGRSMQAGIRGPLYGADDLRTPEEFGFRVITASELREFGFASFGSEVRKRVGSAPVLLTFDIDFVDPAYAPATGTPEVGGFTSAEALEYIRALTGIRLVGCDCVEVAPAYDTAGETTALLAANIAYEMMALHTVSMRAPGPA
jgi:agmatinase